jgi:hypothetical protein
VKRLSDAQVRETVSRSRLSAAAAERVLRLALEGNPAARLSVFVLRVKQDHEAALSRARERGLA